MIHFDDVLVTAHKVVTDDRAVKLIEHVLVLRDLRGRVRLFLRPKQAQEEQVNEACSRLGPLLGNALGGFWGELIEVDSRNSDSHAMLETVRSEARSIEEEDFENWSIIERHVSKSAWAKHDADPPWPLRTDTPGVVCCFSHKGGVGRTTALCAIAMTLARAGKRVTAIDVDLEAPGLGPLLVGTSVEYGVVDYLLEYFVAGCRFEPRLDEFVVLQNDPALIGPSGEPIRCVPAGRVGPSYLEKLARLDYELIAGTQTANGNPLTNLMKQLRSLNQPEYILLDCRSGLHDLGGLAIQCLSHLAIVFGLDSEASWDGLRLVMQRMRQSGTSCRCLTVHAMEPPPGDIRKQARDRFLAKSYEIFMDEYYVDPEDKVPPNVDDRDAPHFPFRIAHSPALSGYQSLSDVEELLTREPYSALAERVATMLGKPIK